MDISEILYFCAILSSLDGGPALSVVNYDLQPALYSLTFGQGIFNDALVLILF